MLHSFPENLPLRSSGLKPSTLQLGCLALLWALILPFMFFYTSHNYIFLYCVQNYLVLPASVFLGLSMAGNSFWSSKKIWVLCLIPVLWFFITEFIVRYNYGSVQPFSLYLPAYLIAFPFAAFSGDGSLRKGLAVTGGFFLAYALVKAGHTLLCLLNILPGFPLDGVTWDGSRLFYFFHPNVTACILFIGSAFALYFLLKTENLKLRVLWGIAMAGQLVCLALTNSRTSILLTGGFLGAVVFFLQIHKGWKRMLLAALLGLLIIPVFFNAAKGLYEWHEDRLIQYYLSQSEDSSVPVQVDPNTGEVTLQTLTTSGQGEFLDNLSSFNGRTTLWKTALMAVWNDPSIALRGTDNVIATMASYTGYDVHTHNSWFQVLLNRGIPGLAIALVFTVLTLRNGLLVLFDPRTSNENRVIALLALGIMAAGSMEPYLFTGDINYFFVELVFFTCSGYLWVWCKKDKN